ncbi:MAG: hypothetical protein Q7N50_12420 [Armatimonadota bacterium]|nr:hypothetical protein [Armatimonadota bacterium]
MDFLNDKKNQPYIIGATIAVILGVGLFLYLKSRPAQPSASAPVETAQATDMSAQQQMAPGTIPDPNAAPATPPTDPMAMGGSSGTPGAAQPGAAGQQSAGNPKPIEKSRPDPFKMLNKPLPPSRQVVVREAVPYPTWLIIPRRIEKGDDQGQVAGQPVDTTPRRMAGILYDGTVSAILETGGSSLVVKPGDFIENRTLYVERIEPSRIVLKTVGEQQSRYVVVKMMAAPSGSGAGPASSASPGVLGPGSNRGNTRYGMQGT